jgi:hypothetical protein
MYENDAFNEWGAFMNYVPRKELFKVSLEKDLKNISKKIVT